MTKSKLLASTILISAAAAMAAPSAGALSLKIKGGAEFWAGFADNEAAAGVSNNFDVKHDAEIHFRGEEKLDNGLKIGVVIEMSAGNGKVGGTGSLFDETSAYVKASWGKISIGNNDVASSYVGGIKVVGPVGIIKSDAGDWFLGNYELNNTDADAGVGDAQNITYFSPKVGGAQIIVSYTPDSSDGVTSDYDDTETSGIHNAVSGSINYSAKLDGGKIRVAAGYTAVEATDADGNDTREAWSTSLKVSVGAATITAAYASENLTDRDTFWGVGLIWKLDKTQKISIGYGFGEETKRGAGVDNQDSSVVTLGYTRNLGKGVSLAASIFRADLDAAGTGSANDREGWGAVGGLKIKF